MDQVLRHRDAEAAGGDLGKAGADRQQAIAIGKGVARRRHGGGAETEAGMQRMGGGKYRQSLQRGGHRRLQELGDGACLVHRIAGAPADEHGRVPGAEQHFGGATDLRGGCPLWPGDDWPAGHFAHLAGEHLQVHRDFDEDRSGLAGIRDLPGLEQGGHDLGVAGDVEGRLGQRLEEGMLVEFV